MDSQEAQRRALVRESRCICSHPQLCSGQQKQQQRQRAAYHSSSQGASHKSPVVVPSVGFSTYSAKLPSALPLNSEPPEQLSLPPLTSTTIPSPSWALNASVSTSTASMISSTPVKDTSINVLHSCPGASRQQQHPLPILCEAAPPSTPRRACGASPSPRRHLVPHYGEDDVSTSLTQCHCSPLGRTQARRGAETGLVDVGAHAQMLADALISISPVAATLTADAKDDSVQAKTASLPAPRMPAQRRGNARALHGLSGSGSASRVTSEQISLSLSIAALPLERVIVRAVEARAVTKNDTALQPHSPLTSIHITPHPPAVAKVPQRLQVTLAAHASGSMSGKLGAFGRSRPAVSHPHTSRIPETGNGASEGSDQPSPLSSHPPTSSRLLGTEEACGDRNGGLQVLLPCPTQPESSPSCLMSTSERTAGKSCADSVASASDALYVPQSDSEHLLMLSSTYCHSAYSVKASPNMVELLPFIDPLAGRKGVPCTCACASPRRPCGRRTHSSVADFFTSFDTTGGTMSCSSVAFEHGVVVLPGSDIAQTRSSTLEPRPTRSGGNFCTKHVPPSNGSTTMSTMRVVETIRPLTAPLRALPLSPVDEEERRACEPPPNHDCQQIRYALATTTPRSTPHSPVDVLPLEGPTRDCSAVKSATTVTATAATDTSPSFPATSATEGNMETIAQHGILPFWLEWQWESSSPRSTSIISMGSSLLGCISPCPAAAAGRRRDGEQWRYGSRRSSLVDVPPHVGGAQGLPFCSLNLSDVPAWVEDTTVDAALDVCATTLSSILRKTDSSLRTPDSSVDSGSSLLWLMPRSEFAAGVSGILRPHSSFCHSYIGLPRQATRTCGSSLHQRPLPMPSLPVTIADFTKSVSLNRTIPVNSARSSLVEVGEGDASPVGTTTSTSLTATALPSTTRSTTWVFVSQVGQSGAGEGEEEPVVVSDMMIGLAPAQNATMMTPRVSEEMRSSCICAIDVLLQDPDVPPFAKAANQRLYQLQRAPSHSMHPPSDLVCSGREDLAAETPVIDITTTSSGSCPCKSHSCITQPRSFIASAAGAQGSRSTEQLSPTPSNAQAQTGQPSVPLVSCLYEERFHLSDVHKYSKQQQQMKNVPL